MNYRIIYGDELYHYGVPGMKWGHRKPEERYAARSERWARRESRAKTTLGKNFAGSMRIHNKYNAEEAKATRKNVSSGNVKGVLRQKYGAEGFARSQKREAELYKMKADRSRTKLGKKVNSNLSYNAAQRAAHWEKVAGSSDSSKKRAKYHIKNAMKVPMRTTIRGRQTTAGRELAKNIAMDFAIGD